MEEIENIVKENSTQTEAELKEQVVKAIKEVYDPEIPVDVYELGLIYEIKVFPVNNVYVLMTLTSPSCPSAEAIPSEVEQKIRDIEGVSDVSVELTFDPPYSQEMMSEVAKLELGFM
jgi:FeS assembly SUF system protein